MTFLFIQAYNLSLFEIAVLSAFFESEGFKILYKKLVRRGELFQKALV